MTVKLYEKDAYLHQFDATVLSCVPLANGFAVTLDQTAFFPEGGGQAADTGHLQDAAVRDVQIEEGEIVHKTDKPLAVGETIHGAIDWPKRFCRMQQHTGEHLVSGLIHTMYGWDNVGFHMSDKTVTLDVNGTLTALDVAALEQAVNRAIYENVAVAVSFPSGEELKTLCYRSKLDLTEDVRLITIEGYDVCACCAPHVARTGEIGLVKILDFSPYKGGTRLEIVSGRQALEDYIALHEANRALMQSLSAPREKIVEFVQRDHDLIAALREEQKRLAEKLALAQLQTQRCGEVLCAFTKDADFEALRVCAEHLAADGILCAVFSDESDNQKLYFLSQPYGDVRDAVKALNARFHGKGGGRPAYAQGKLTATREQLVAFFGEKGGV